MEITNLNFLSVFLYIIISIIVFYLAYNWYKKQVFVNLNFKKLSVHKYFFVKYIFLILSFLIILFSIFGIKSWVSNSLKQNWIDIVFVLDVSKSMLVADIWGNDNFTRLDFAKQSISDYITNNLNNRYGLVIFSWDAVSSVPLTSDLNLFSSVLKNVDYRNLISQWTNFTKAFELWFDRFNFTDDKSGALIFLSDGWEWTDSIDNDYLSKLKSDKIQVFLWWIWTEKGGKIITWVDVFGRVSYQTYLWDYVVSKYNSDNMKLLSSIFDARYETFSSSADIKKFENDISKIETKVIENKASTTKQDFSRTLSFISFFFFILYLVFYMFEDRFYFVKNKNA